MSNQSEKLERARKEGYEKGKAECKDLREAYDIAMDEINKLRKELYESMEMEGKK